MDRLLKRLHRPPPATAPADDLHEPWPSAAELEQATQCRFFALMVGFVLIMTVAFSVTFALHGLWVDALRNAGMGAFGAACCLWAWRTGHVTAPMRALSIVLVAMLAWQTLRQGASLPAAGWWLSVIPFLLAGAGLHRMAVAVVVVFVVVVTLLFVGPPMQSLGLVPEDDLGPTRQYIAVVGSEFFALAMILMAVRRRREAAQAIEVARAAASEAVTAKSRFLAHVSHEIRTPLNGVIGTADLLRSPHLDDSQREQLLELQQQSTRTLLTLVNDVLDWTKLEVGKVVLESRPLHLKRLVLESNELLAVQAYDKGIDLTSSCNPDVPQRVVGDATRLRQIIDNLVGNAVKFTATGGVHIHVSLDADDAAAARAAAPTRWVRIEVVDSGIGIEPHRLAGLFTAFAQADESITRRYGGTGLGLAISLELARLMGGRIEAASVPGSGSTFALVVPLEVAGVERPGQATRARRDVVVASASPGVLRHLNAMLHDIGIEPRLVRELGDADGDGCRVMMVDAPLLTALPDPESWLQRKHRAGCRVAVITPPGAGPALGSRLHLPLLLKPVRPASLQAVLHELDREPAAMPAPGSRAALHVLVAEDHAVNQIVVQAMLNELGASSVVAANGREALDCLAAQRFDLVLMDMQMPEMDGATATRAWRAIEAAEARARRVPVIAMTASTPADQPALWCDSGMDGILPKPFGLAELRRVLRSVGGGAR
jgi:signal transduction histidine kinase/CheY-like chemotaxis protein